MSEPDNRAADDITGPLIDKSGGASKLTDRALLFSVPVVVLFVTFLVLTEQAPWVGLDEYFKDIAAGSAFGGIAVFVVAAGYAIGLVSNLLAEALAWTCCALKLICGATGSSRCFGSSYEVLLPPTVKALLKKKYFNHAEAELGSNYPNRSDLMKV